MGNFFSPFFICIFAIQTTQINTSLKMARISKDALETMYGKLIDEKELEISGFKKPLKFEVYDGYAYCPNYKGHEYAIEYPRVELIEKSKEMQEDIKGWLDMKEDETITVYDIIQTFNTMYRDGVKVKFDKAKDKWIEVK
jgi:hypothetical protein